MNPITYKCVVCGGELENIGKGMGQCAYCRTKQSMPTIESKKLERANKIRRELLDFNKALSLYEEVISESPDEAEAYWGAVICRYGIEFVEDHDKSIKPTCHRTIETSIMKDPDFIAACEKSQDDQRKFYTGLAAQIDEIQNKILDIVRKEKPYDIFISYKATDDNGQPTADSKEAQKLFYKLEGEGYNVFFAEDTLLHKAGSEYEPIIYAALKSSNVMILLGSSEENFNAKWVKNEWSRYIDMMNNDSKKNLLVVYYGMDAYDLPKELKSRQAINWHNAEAMNIILENVENASSGTVVNKKTQEINDLIRLREREKADIKFKNAVTLLESGNEDSALTQLNAIIREAPEYHEAYWLRLCIKLHVTEDELRHIRYDLKKEADYIAAVSNADPKSRAKYEKICKHCNSNIQTQREYNNEVRATVNSCLAINNDKIIDSAKFRELEEKMNKAIEKEVFAKRTLPKKTVRTSVFMLIITVVLYVCGQALGNYLNDNVLDILSGFGLYIVFGIVSLLYYLLCISNIMNHRFMIGKFGIVTGIGAMAMSIFYTHGNQGGILKIAPMIKISSLPDTKISLWEIMSLHIFVLIIFIIRYSLIKTRDSIKNPARASAEEALKEYKRLLVSADEKLISEMNSIYEKYCEKKLEPNDELIQAEDRSFTKFVNEKITKYSEALVIKEVSIAKYDFLNDNSDLIAKEIEEMKAEKELTK